MASISVTGYDEMNCVVFYLRDCRFIAFLASDAAGEEDYLIAGFEVLALVSRRLCARLRIVFGDWTFIFGCY